MQLAFDDGMPLNSTDVFNQSRHFQDRYPISAAVTGCNRNKSTVTIESELGSVYLVLPILLLCCVTLGANLIVIVTIGLVNTLRSVTSAFLVNLAVCDLLIAGGVLPLAAINLAVQDIDKATCSAMGFLASVFGASSVLTLVAIAIDRYHAIIHCLEYHTKSNSRFAAKLLAWIWVQAVVCSSLPLFGWGEYAQIPGSFVCGSRWETHLPYAICLLITCFLFPVIAMSYCYISIIRVARQHVRQITDLQVAMMQRFGHSKRDDASFSTGHLTPGRSRFECSSDSQPSHRGSDVTPSGLYPFEQNRNSQVQMEMSNFKKELKATVRLLGPVLVVILCWLPYLSVRFVGAVKGPGCISDTVYLSTAWLTYLNAALNPFLYAASNRRFRLAVRSLLKIKTNPMVRSKRIGHRIHASANGIEADIAVSTIASAHGVTGAISVDYLNVPSRSANGSHSQIGSRSVSRGTSDSFLGKVNIEVACNLRKSSYNMRVCGEEEHDSSQNDLTSRRRHSLPPPRTTLGQSVVRDNSGVNTLTTTISVENVSESMQVCSKINVHCRSRSLYDIPLPAKY